MGRKDKIVSTNNNLSNPVGARMRFARQQKDISLTDMARFLMYTKSYLSAVENGTSKPSQQLIDGYERVLELEPGALTSLNEAILLEARYSSESGNRLESPAGKGAGSGREGISSVQPLRLIAGRGHGFIDWGAAPRVPVFYGYKEELSILEKSIIADSCKVVVVYGLGGIGKTAISLKVARHIREQFEVIFWRSLRDAPKLDTILRDFMGLFFPDEQKELPERLNEQLKLLVECLSKSRCLLIFDNFDSVLEAGKPTGQYLDGYDGYGKLIEQVGETEHKSCLLITSREKPKEVARQEGSSSPVRSNQLPGIGTSEVPELLKDKGINGDDEAWEKLAERYSGNPLALKLASTIIREVFKSDIAAFLQSGGLLVEDVYDLLNQQFERLSSQEQEILYWLAIEREAVSLDDLQEDIIGLDRQELYTLLNSLRFRSMIEVTGPKMFSLQPVVMEFVTQKFVEQIEAEIRDGAFKFFERCALIKAQAKDYLREGQVRVILQPLTRHLLTALGREGTEKRLQEVLAWVRTNHRNMPGYAAGNVLNLLVELGCDLRGADFSHLFVWQAYMQGESLPGINFAYANLEKSVFTDAFGSILSVALRPDGHMLAAGTANGEVRLWDARGKLLQTLRGHANRIRTVNFSPDGRLLVSGSEDQAVRLWDVESGECLHILTGHTNRVRAVGFSPDSNWLVSGGDDQVLLIWDAKTGRCLNTSPGHTNRINAVGISPDGKLIASGSEDQTIGIWDARTGKNVRYLSGTAHQIYSLSFSRNNSKIVSGSEDQTIQIWDVKTGQLLKILQGHKKRVRAVGFSPDPASSRVASGSDDQTVRLWDVESGQCLKIFYGHTQRVRAVAYGVDGKSIVSGSDDQTVRLWDVETGQCLKMLQGHGNRIYSVAFSPDDKRLVSGSDDKLIRLWDIANVKEGKLLKTLPGHNGRVYGVAFSSDGTSIVSGSDDQSVGIWNVASGLRLQTLQEHTNWVRCVAFSPDGTQVASGSQDSTVRLWDAKTGLCLRTLEGHTDWVRSVNFSADGQTIISGSEDQTVRLWDAGTGECVRVLKEHEKGVRSACFNAPGTLIASGSDDDRVRLWDASTGELLHVLTGHIGWILSVDFHPAQAVLVSGSEDQTIRLWDIETGHCLNVLRGHTGGVYCVVFSSTGEQLASASHDGVIRLWDVSSGECLAILRNDRPYEGMDITDVRGLTMAQENMLKALGALER
ncbi:MAG TPA: NB-ARC domain-containing protein [Ktedonobacteraceae bacterium]|nr:NB-ARC domain-containing protein [Ktedonobacteraceae bacterium]